MQFDSNLKKWIVTDEPLNCKNKDNIFLAALYVYLKKHIDFCGTPSELVNVLKSVSDETFYPNRAIDLRAETVTLPRENGIDFQYKNEQETAD